MKDPNNENTSKNPVGRFMVAVGAIVQLKGTNKILLIKRNENEDWQPGEWEIPYGRIDQFEDLSTGLRREVKEETGLTNLKIGNILTNWHIFRGQISAHNEVIGLTFVCETSHEKIKLSFEHCEYQWCEPEEAIKLISTEGIKRDVLAFIDQISKF